MFLPLGTVLHSHSSAHDTTAFVKQRVTILTFAVKQESGACCSTYRLCSPCLWRSCSELHAKHCLPCPSPTRSSPHPAVLSLPSKAGVTTSCRHCVTQCPKHVPSLQLLLLLRKIADRHSVYITGRMCNDTLVRLYLYCVGCEAVPQGEDALVSDNLWETVDHSREMDVDSAEVRQTSTLRLQKLKSETVVNQRCVCFVFQ